VRTPGRCAACSPGQALVVVVGLVVIAIGVHQVRKELRSDLLDEIGASTVSPALCTLIHRASQAGFALKGVALVLVGAVVAEAAATFDPARATGLDGALRAVAAEPHAPGCWSWSPSGWPPSRYTA
jgi:uncharacterized protein DUF1206